MYIVKEFLLNNVSSTNVIITGIEANNFELAKHIIIVALNKNIPDWKELENTEFTFKYGANDLFGVLESKEFGILS
jgi:hypothetical protein